MAPPLVRYYFSQLTPQDSKDKDYPTDDEKNRDHRIVENAEKRVFFRETRDNIKDNQCHNQHEYYAGSPGHPVIKNLA